MNVKLDWKKMTSVGVLIAVLIGIMAFTGANDERYYEISKDKMEEKGEVEKNVVMDISEESELENQERQQDLKSQEPQKAIVYICGAVKSPMVAELTTEHRLNDAVNIAGGLSDSANREGVNLAMKISDGAQYIIPQKGEQLIINYDNGSFSVSLEPVKGQNLISEEAGKVNINSADVKALQELTGIGEVLGERIIKYREEHKGFKSIEQLKEVEGIGDKKYEDIKDEVTV